MSGKNLPSHCAVVGPSYCSWQFPNVAMSSATDAKTYAQRWSAKPGFLDPFHVAFQCIKRLKGAAFVNVKYGRKHESQADKSQLCPGLQIYFAKIVQNAEVSNDLEEHIAVGAADKLTAVIRNYPCLENVLLYLMKYLKERGPLLKFKYNSREMLNSIVANPRFLVTTFMNTLCEFELEFQAAVTIGDYLNYLIFVAFAHDMFWFKELLADIWGPLLVDFVNVGVKGSDTLKEHEKKDRLKLVTLRLLETIPWERLKNVENFKVTINPQVNDSYLKRKSSEAASEMQRLTTRPLGTVTLLTSGEDGAGTSGIMRLLGDLTAEPSAKVQTDETDDPAAVAAKEAAELESKRRAEELAKKANCEKENQNYISEYGYTPEFIAAHVPHGMCRPGFDTTI